MEKEFNYTGICIPEMHYMADISGKLESTIKLIKKGKYITINYPTDLSFSQEEIEKE